MSKTPAYLINGEFERGMTPLDRGLNYGDGVFRTFRVVEGLPVDWPLHYQKLVADCSAIGIVCPSAEVLMEDIQRLFTMHDTAVSKIIVTRGEGERGYAPPAVTSPNRIVFKSAMPNYPDRYHTEGVALYLCQTALSHQPLLAGIKHLNRLENVLARSEWRDPSYADGLMLDLKGYVIECISANLFARYGQELWTPSLDQCGVAGVTRQKVINLASSIGLTVRDKNLFMNELLNADEVVMVNSLIGAWQVRSVTSKCWPRGLLANELREVLSQ
jgi:4-amino-4-deoxychorismate lyase